MLVHRKVTPTPAPPPLAFYQASADTHLHSTWVDRGTVRVQRLAHEHNSLTLPGLEVRPLESESTVLTASPEMVRCIYSELLRNNYIRLCSWVQRKAKYCKWIDTYEDLKPQTVLWNLSVYKTNCQNQNETSPTCNFQWNKHHNDNLRQKVVAQGFEVIYHRVSGRHHQILS